MSQDSHPAATPQVSHIVVGTTCTKESSKKYRAKKSMKPSIGHDELARLTYVELLEESLPRSEGIMLHHSTQNQDSGQQHRKHSRMMSDKVENVDRGLKYKPPLPPQHKQKPEIEHITKGPVTATTGVSHLDTTTLSAVITEQQASLPSIIMPDSDVSGTAAGDQGIRHSTPIERLAALKDIGASLKRLGSTSSVVKTADATDGASQTTSGKSISKNEKSRRERRQSGVISTRVPHRSGSSSNTSLHSVSKHGRVKSAPSASVEKLKKRLTKKDSTKLIKQPKMESTPSKTDKRTQLKLGKSKHKSDKVKIKHSKEDSKKLSTDQVGSECLEKENSRKSKEGKSSKTKRSRSKSKSTKKKETSKSGAGSIIISGAIVDYHGSNPRTVSSTSTVSDVTTSVRPGTSCTNVTASSLGSSASDERLTNVLLEIPTDIHHLQKRSGSSLNEEAPLSIVRNKKLRNLEQPPAFHNKSKLDKMFSAVACLSAQKSPTSHRRARQSLPVSCETGRTKKRLWMSGRGSPEDIFGESLSGGGSMGTSMYDSSRISFGGFYTGPRKRSNSDSLSECSRVETSERREDQRRKRRKSNTVLELSTLGAHFNTDLPRPDSAMALRKEDITDLLTSGGILRCPVGSGKDQFTHDMLELCKNIKESSWMQNSGGKALDSSVLLSLNQLHGEQIIAEANAADNSPEDLDDCDQNYIPPERPDVNEDAPNVLDIISKINKIAKDSNNNNPLELFVPKTYFSPAALKKTDNVQSKELPISPAKYSLLLNESQNSEHFSDTEQHIIENIESRPPTGASSSATFIVNSSLDASGAQKSQLLSPSNECSRHVSHSDYNDSLNIQFNSPTHENAEECFQNGGVCPQISQTVSEDERAVEAIISRYIPDKSVTGQGKGDGSAMNKSTGKPSRSERKDSGPRVRGDSACESSPTVANVTDVRRLEKDVTQSTEKQFSKKEVGRATYDPSTQAALLSNREEKRPQTRPLEALDLRIQQKKADGGGPDGGIPLKGVGHSLLEEASVCMHEANNLQNTAFSNLVQHLTHQHALIENLQLQLNSQKKQRIAAEQTLKVLTDTRSSKKN